ncbi:MAG: type IV secretion system DNA-binding domain-containing protein [Acidobacteriota bacterium]|nr:type IV secretion system DNA-binding domain-containing protein [Acidobacteriota bacterium]MDE3265428.1 type IV secretion system DNA-binding domain-containing protein [Acidobacteriota bacterium]
MNLEAERTDHEAAGSLAEELPYWGWLEDHPFCLTRGGELLAVAELSQAVVDGRTPQQMDEVLGRWLRLLSSLDPHTRLYFYLLRRPGRLAAIDGLDGLAAISQEKRRSFLERRVQELRAYVVWSHDAELKANARTGNAGVLAAAQDWIKSRMKPDECAFLLRHVTDAAERFRQLVGASAALASDVTPLRVLPAEEATAVLSGLVNRPGQPWHGDHIPSALNWRLALSELEAERRFLRLDGQPLILYNLTSPPVQARANLLQELYRLDALLTVSLEWRPQPLASSRRKIRSVQRHYFSKRYSMVAHMQDAQGTAAAMVDSAADAESARIAHALVELETEGVAYGDISLTIALHGDDLARIEALDAELFRIFGAADAKVIREGFGQLPAWWSRLPGQPRKRQVRTVFSSAGVAACMAPLFGPPPGQAECKHLEKPAMATFETPWKTPYHYDLFGGSDVGHTLILGATGAGKSFALNFLLVQSQHYAPRVLVLDLGGSYKWLTEFIGGGYLELNPDADGDEIALKPFSLPPGERTFSFLTGWIARLLRIGGYTLRGEDTTELRERVEDLYRSPAEDRTLSALVRTLPAAMWPAMSRWHGEGAWAKFFDGGGEDTLELADWQVIDLAGAAEHDDLCEAALFFLLERLRLALDDPAEAARVKLMVVDEAWRYLNDRAVLTYLAEAAKTWRKRNAALVLATQSAVDLTDTEGAQALLESLPTKLFLANPDLPDGVQATFRLNDTEMQTIRGLLPKREMYLRRAQEAGVVRLEVDPESYWLYTSSPVDGERRAQAVAEHGLAAALEVLANQRR